MGNHSFVERAKVRFSFNDRPAKAAVYVAAQTIAMPDPDPNRRVTNVALAGSGGSSNHGMS